MCVFWYELEVIGIRKGTYLSVGLMDLECGLNSYYTEVILEAETNGILNKAISINYYCKIDRKVSGQTILDE